MSSEATCVASAPSCRFVTGACLSLERACVQARLYSLPECAAYYLKTQNSDCVTVKSEELCAKHVSSSTPAIQKETAAEVAAAEGLYRAECPGGSGGSLASSPTVLTALLIVSSMLLVLY